MNKLKFISSTPLHAQAFVPKAELGWECLPQHLTQSTRTRTLVTGKVL